jgi:hypothetical protein
VEQTDLQAGNPEKQQQGLNLEWIADFLRLEAWLEALVYRDAPDLVHSAYQAAIVEHCN